jgi:tRNA pseudouridine synthase 9
VQIYTNVKTIDVTICRLKAFSLALPSRFLGSFARLPASFFSASIITHGTYSFGTATMDSSADGEDAFLDGLPIDITPSTSPTPERRRDIEKQRLKKEQRNFKKDKYQLSPNEQRIQATDLPHLPSNPSNEHGTVFLAVRRAARKKMNKEQRKAQSAIPDPSTPLITPYSGPLHPEYFFEDGLRKVKPYHFTYNTFAKQRFLGKTLVNVYNDEFRDRPVDYYRNAILKGDIIVNGKRVPEEEVDTIILSNGDLITHTTHRHEPPVNAQAIGIVYEDDEIMVIDKPAGIAVHPAGRYRFNSITEILRSERRAEDLDPLPCNRLDRLTSGIMFIAKSTVAAEAMTQQLIARSIRKEYVARVLGEFPDGEIVCEEPILSISPKLGLNAVRKEGKSAKTMFRKVAYYPGTKETVPELANGDGTKGEVEGQPWKKYTGYSIVRCFPLTGRTHQIRVHLQFLGHPISNDPIYANQRVFGPTLGKWQVNSGKRKKRDPAIPAAASNESNPIVDIEAQEASDVESDVQYPDDETIISRLNEMGKSEVATAVAYSTDFPEQDSNLVAFHSEIHGQFLSRKAERMTGETCPDCGTELYSDPGQHELGIYLHARRYECADGRWGFEGKWPKWAGDCPEGLEGGMAFRVKSNGEKVGLGGEGTLLEK